MQVPVFLRVVMALATALLFCTSQAQAQAETESAPAKLNALSRVQLSSELAARITEVRVRAGNHFKKGDLLARFDCTELKAELEGAESQRALARRQLEANISLRQLGGNISELEMVQSEAQLADATAKRKVLAHRNTYCDVYAPFAGFVVNRQVEPHQRVEIGTPLFELVDNRGLEVEAIIPSGWLDKLSVGTAFRVTINESGREYNAVLQRIVPVVDPVTRTVRVIGQLEERPQNFSSTLLISGMSGEAHFALSDKSDDMLADRTHHGASEGAN